MNNKFAENLKKIRKEHNLSQEEIAEELKVSRQAISKWESSAAYPEMDKIIALCDKFNVNIDDLLHRNIKEVKEEEESKKTFNKAVDDFLKFITDTISLFSNMSFKSKVKCLIEQIIIIGILVIISNVIVEFSSFTFLKLLSFLPSRSKFLLNDVLNTILIILCVVASITIVIHVFRTRYLNYYSKLKEDLNNVELNKNEPILIKENEEDKIKFNQNANKIIIRDPLHSEYRFINSLFKFILGIIKFFVLCFTAFICFILIILLITLVLSFLIFKSGLFFLGLFISLIALISLTVIILLIALNFIFNRKNNKKGIIWSFIASLIVLGSGIGLTFTGTLNFTILKNNEIPLKTNKIEFDMNDNTFFNSHFSNLKIEYIPTSIDNIIVEYKINKFYDIETFASSRDGIELYPYCSEPILLIKEGIKNLNNKKIISIDQSIQEVKVYASSENIAKMKFNSENYLNNLNDHNKIVNYYENKIDELETKISNYETKFNEYENTIAGLKNKIDEYQSIIETYENAE